MTPPGDGRPPEGGAGGPLHPRRPLPPPKRLPTPADRARREREQAEARHRRELALRERERAQRDQAVHEREQARQARARAAGGDRRAPTGRGGVPASAQGSRRPGRGATRRPSRTAVRRARAGSLVALVAVVLAVVAGVHRLGGRGASAAQLAGQGTATAPAGGRGASVTSSGARPAAKRSAPIAIGLAWCNFVDPSRPTYNFLTGVSVPGRRLVTEIRYPAAHGSTTSENPGARPLLRRGGYPVVVFADGYDVTPDVYRALLDAWVRAGFVVVAPLFPDTSSTAITAQHGVLTENDNVNEPADLAFVTRRMAHASLVATPACRVLHGLVSPGRMLLAGQSDGGQVVAALAYDNAFAGVLGSLSYRAVAVLSGDDIGSGTYTAGPGAPPMLVVQSNADACNPPQAATTLYNAVPLGAKWFLLLHGVHHLSPYDGTAKAAFAVVSAVTSRWFHLELAHATPAAGFLAFGNRRPAVATMTTGPTAPPVPQLVFSKAACYLH